MTDNSISSTTARQWQILSHLQRGRWTGTIELLEHLKFDGFDVSLRTVQRDLNTLSKRFLLEKNNANPQGWRWHNDAPLQSMPNMDTYQSIAFSMVEANLSQLLPPSILNELQPWFEQAHKQLHQNDNTQRWFDRVQIEHANQPLIPPNIDVNIRNDIYQAVFEQTQIQTTYSSRATKSPKKYHLNPLAIVQRGEVFYLLATKHAEDTIKTFALHRFHSVQLLENHPAIIPDDFNLSELINNGIMGFSEQAFQTLPNSGKDTDVELVFDKNVAHHLTESKLSLTQTIHENEKHIIINANINLTSQLVWWLRGFGKGLISAKPQILFDVVKEQ